MTNQLQGVEQILEAALGVCMLIQQKTESLQQITEASLEFSSQAELLIEELKRFKLS